MDRERSSGLDHLPECGDGVLLPITAKMTSDAFLFLDGTGIKNKEACHSPLTEGRPEETIKREISRD